jgi:hypothetical protein
LDRYDNGYLTEIEDLKTWMEKEKILRPSSEIRSLISKNNAVKRVSQNYIIFST